MEVRKDEQTKGELISIISDLAQKLGNDEIQDLYQSDMDADGYFDEIE